MRMNFPLIHNIHYTWTGWPTPDISFPPEPDAAFFASLVLLWAKDGLELVSREWKQNLLHMSFRAEPGVSPVFCASRVKGRLQHALRAKGLPNAFSRKVSVRALGINVSDIVTRYLRNQTVHADYADPRYLRQFSDAAEEDASLDLSQPIETGSGRYWYNLHMVLVTENRVKIGKEDFLPKIPAAVEKWASGSGCAVKSVAVMPEHIHLLFRGAPDKSPAELAESCWSILNRGAGCRLYSDRIYIGTCSEYTLRAVL